MRLEEIRPLIRRRFLLSPTATFFDLNEAIQDSFGWSGYHMWAFHERARDPAIAGIPSPEDFGPSAPDAKKVRLASYFGEGRSTKCLYVYDFGEDWFHEVRYAGRERRPESFRRRLVDGARAGPPEDCGGIGGYERCEALVRGKLRESAEEKRELREWLGDWDPERFDLEAAKRRFDR